MLDLNELVKLSHDLKLLYVEDDKATRIVTERLFKKFFNNITVATDGEEGLERFKNEIFDMVITDINMPQLDGLEMAQKIKEIDSTIPIVIASAYNNSDLFIKSIKIGIDGYLFKPLEVNQFASTIQKIAQNIKNKADAIKEKKI